MHQQPSNGSTKIEVGIQDMGGWVRVVGSQNSATYNELPYYLAHRLSNWFRQNPHQRLRCVVPINRDGNTIELHGWYEQHVFPDQSPLA